ncbi:MAG: hypothetical protein M2R45_01004 [Verrucomicrobia subdivision 3 bacterium]|nr:hypothetical protein [Limisphaerales bacterium]MCS1414114.1 hypothetical protein [Limisphaerales bacterium]
MIYVEALCSRYLLPNATAEQILARYFHRNHMGMVKGQKPKESRIAYVIDRVTKHRGDGLVEIDARPLTMPFTSSIRFLRKSIIS